MELIPVVMPPGGAPSATREQLDAAYSLCANVSAVFYRMIGRGLVVGEPVSVANTENDAPALGRAYKDRVAWDDDVPGMRLYEGARNALTTAGYDPADDVYAVWLLGNVLDGSGRGGPWAANGWMDDPNKGGVAVMGEKRLQNAVSLQPDPHTGYYRSSTPIRDSDPAVQIRLAIWLASHEVGHALGLNHTNGEPLDPIAMTQSIMAYGRVGWAKGEYAHNVGLRYNEIDWLRGHSMFDSAEGRMKQMDPEEALRVLRGDISLRLGLGPGVTVEELIGAAG